MVALTVQCPVLCCYLHECVCHLHPEIFHSLSIVCRVCCVQDDTFAFDIGTDPRRPKLVNTTQLTLTATTDHVFGLKNGNLLLTQVSGRCSLSQLHNVLAWESTCASVRLVGSTQL
jgi:hypothetical protein